jgi:hypothetical protein
MNVSKILFCFPVILFIQCFLFTYGQNQEDIKLKPTGCKGRVLYIAPDNKSIVYSNSKIIVAGELNNIFFSCYNPGNNLWSEPVKIVFDDDAVKQGTQRSELFITLSNRKGQTDIFSCIYYNGKCSTPKKLNENINSKYDEGCACLSNDGTALYFSSNRTGGCGGFDIYKSERTENGDWGPAMNLGWAINTESDEDAPFLLRDDATLYFSSKGHKGKGGFDIFSSTCGEEGMWSFAENAGEINTAADDLFYCLSGDERKAFYSSVVAKKQNSMNYQIYEVSY